MAGCIVNFALLCTLDTYSFFSSSEKKVFAVTAAEEKDILSAISLADVNPRYIEINKAETVKYDPVIYFSVNGDAADYLAHINPIKMSRENYRVPIVPNFSLEQFMSLLYGNDSLVKGSLKVKYLNGFIDREEDIEFTKEYLIDQFLEDIAGKGIGSSSGDSTRDAVMRLVTYIAGQQDWEINSNWEIMTAVQDRGAAAGTISGLELSSDQWAIINIIAPRLRKHLDSLYSENEDLIRRLSQYILDLANLATANEKLQAENISLQEQLTGTQQEIDRLKAEINKLQDEAAASQPQPPPPDQNTGEPTALDQGNDGQPPVGQGTIQIPEQQEDAQERQQPQQPEGDTAPVEGTDEPEAPAGSPVEPRTQDTGSAEQGTDAQPSSEQQIGDTTPRQQEIPSDNL
jgi:cell division protein FtsB